MAGDWLKVEKITPDKPEIVILAKKLNISRGEAFDCWFRLYRWADGITKDGFVPFLSASDADASVGIPGICEALASPEIQWMQVESGGIRFLKFDRHNGKSAKRRALETERKRNERNSSANCPHEKRTESGPEKRREENNTNTPLPPLESQAFNRFWSAWPPHKRKAARPKCLSHWLAKKLDAEAEAIMSGLEAAKQSKDWTKGDGEYIPAPHRWLNERRWEALMFQIVQPKGATARPGEFQETLTLDGI